MLKFRKETEYDVICAATSDEIKIAISGGFDFVCEKAGLMFFRRVKRISLAGTPINKRENEIIKSYENAQTLNKQKMVKKSREDFI
jgi:hypothetical protein